MTERSTERRLAFTKGSILALKPPDGRDRVYFYDTKAPSLTVCVTATGQRVFYIYRRVRGRPQRIRLGAFPSMTIEQARKRAAAVNLSINAGGDPQGDKRRIRDEETLGTVFERWLAVHGRPHKRSWKEDARMFKAYLGGWHARPLSSIGKSDVARLHTRLGSESGPYQTNRLLSLLTTLFNFAAANGWPGSNPCRGIRRFPETQRDRFLSGPELRRFFDALADEPDRLGRDFILLALLTGQRRGAVRSMRWSDLDLLAGVWRIPAERSKNAKPTVIPLGTHALTVLHERRKAAISGDEHVLPSHRTNGHLLESRAAWKRLVNRAGLENFRFHDLRRTFASWQAGLGTSLLVIGKSLGHLDAKSASVYGRVDLGPIRQAVEAATTAMLAAGGGAKLLEAPATSGKE